MAHDFNECPDPENFKKFECLNGHTYMARKTSCLFCERCDDIFCDYHGIYLITCNKGLDTEEGMQGTCDCFKEEE